MSFGSLRCLLPSSFFSLLCPFGVCDSFVLVVVLFSFHAKPPSSSSSYPHTYTLLHFTHTRASPRYTYTAGYSLHPHLTDSTYSAVPQVQFFAYIPFCGFVVLKVYSCICLQECDQILKVVRCVCLRSKRLRAKWSLCVVRPSEA